MFTNKLNTNAWIYFLGFIIAFSSINSLAFSQGQLLVDPGFELSTADGSFPSSDYWKNSDAGGGADASCTTTAAHSGSNGLWIYTGNESWAWWSGPYQELSSSVGKVYSASSWIRTPAESENGSWVNGSKACVCILFLNSSKSVLSVKESPGITAINSSWSSYSVKSDPAPTGTAYVRFVCYIEKPQGMSGISVANFDDCFLENILTPETISSPTDISGPSGTYVGKNEGYTVSGASSSLGHSLEYRFDWGDGTISSWGSAGQSHSWSSSGTFSIKGQARCATHTDKVSSWSSTLKSVTVSYLMLSTNVSPSGAGSVTKDPDKTDYSYNEQVQLTAIANSWYEFSNWSGDASGSSNPTTITMNSNKSVTANFAVVAEFGGVCYGPFRDNENPNFGILPTLKELRDDIFFIGKLSHSIRTYGIADSLSEIPEFCQQAGVSCYPGTWISKDKCENEKEIRSLIEIANQNLNSIKGLIVGNEVLLRGDISEEEMIGYIERVKNSTNLEVGTADTWSVWLNHPQLVQSVDFLLVHIHPYWDEISVEHAANYVVEKWENLKAHYPGRPVIIGETGWPTQGEQRGSAYPGEENQRTFILDFFRLANENDIKYFYFEVFDEKWKEEYEGSVGDHWGLYYSNGSLKPLLEDLLPDEAREGIYRPPREVTVTKATLPLLIYINGCSPENGFCPSGWMGDLSGWSGDPKEVLDETCIDSPHSVETCVRITYIPGDEGWGGIYWQYPRNNWGDYLGYAISKEAKLTFWARGKEGGEKAEFKSGGIKKTEKPYHDSFGPVPTDSEVTLTKEWEKYSIDLTDQDLSMVIGGFYWGTNNFQNPSGCTIYLDDIQFEPLIRPPSDVEVHDIPNDNGHSLVISWIPSLSEKDGIVTLYQIYRSRADILTDPIPISDIVSIEELITLEMDNIILIDTVNASNEAKYEYIDACVPVNNVPYYYWVQAVWEYGESEKVAAGYITFVENEPSGFKVSAPYPNPFNPYTTIKYELPFYCSIKLIIYDILGREIAVLRDEMVSSGIHETVWNGKNQDGILVGSGVYIYRVIAGSNKVQGKIMFLR